MTRALILTALVLSTLAQAARAQVSTEEAYRRLRERQEEARRAAASQPTTKPANPSVRSDASPARGAKTGAAGSAMVDFEDPKLGIRLKHPPMWKAGQPGGNARSIAFVDASPDAKDRYADSFSLQVQPYPSKDSIEVIEQVINAALAKATNQFKVISDDSIQVAGHPGRKLIYTGHPNGASDPRNRQFVQALTFINGTLYIFTYATLPERYAKSAPVISEILNSLEVSDPLDRLVKSPSTEPTPAAEQKPATGAAAGLVEYSDSKLGFSIKRPAKWLQPKVNLNYVIVFLESAQMTRIVRSFGPSAPPPPRHRLRPRPIFQRR